MSTNDPRYGPASGGPPAGPPSWGPTGYPPPPGQYPPPYQGPGQYPPPPPYQGPGQYPPAPPPGGGQFPPPQYQGPGGPVPAAPVQFPLPGPAPRRRGGRLRGVLGIVVALAILGGLYGVNAFLKRNDIEKAAVGDCASYDASKTDPYQLTDCANADATYKVLKIVKGGEQCKTVAGAERSKAIDGGEVCLGLNGVDPATAINVAQVGDCIAVVGNDASRVACTSSKATHKVLKVLNNVSKAPSLGPKPCEDIPDASASYGWAWQTTIGDTTISAQAYDVVLCLADV